MFVRVEGNAWPLVMFHQETPDAMDSPSEQRPRRAKSGSLGASKHSERAPGRVSKCARPK